MRVLVAEVKFWQVAVFVGFLILVADIVSLQLPYPDPGFTSAPASKSAHQLPVAPELREMVEILVASEDLSVGWMLTRDELKTSVKLVKIPKDALPPFYLTNTEDVLNKRLKRPMRTGEAFRPQDLSEGFVPVLPGSVDLVSVTVNPYRGSGFIGPGSRVDVLATDKLHAFVLLENMLIVAVETNVAHEKHLPFPATNIASFAVSPKQALALSLAKSRGCSLELLLRLPAEENNPSYNLDALIESLSKGSEHAPEVAPAPRSVR